MKKIYTTLDELPAVLNADEIAAALRISRANAYTLMHSKNFPTIYIGKRMVVLKEKLIEWLYKQPAETK